jgi:hypothetical protein
MVELLRHQVSYRKLRWFAVACIRCPAVDRFSKFHWDVMQEIEDSIDRQFALPEPEWNVGPALNALLATNAYYAARRAAEVALAAAQPEITVSKEMLIAHLRDVFGNPFQPVAFDPAWRTSTAIALAQQMYDSRDFSLMPILADALEDAGCDSDDVLAHCRGDGPHVRGCWVVDLVLGKE